MRTRVLPEPAGAMTRAGPPTWATAASWSGARSAVRLDGGGDDGQRAEVDAVAVDDDEAVRRRHPWAAVDPRRACRRGG